MKNYYTILGVEKDSDSITIKKAYKLLAKKFHPDLNKNSSAQLKFIEITEAYKILNDQFERIKYDQFIYTQEINNLSQENTKPFILNNYKYYVFILLIFSVFIISYYQFTPTSEPVVTQQQKLIKSNTKKVEFNSNKENNTPEKITQDKDVVVITHDIAKKQTLKKIIVKKSQDHAKKSLASNLIIHENTIPKIEIEKVKSINNNELIVSKKEELVVENSDKKETALNNNLKEDKTTIASKKDKPFNIYNNTSANSSKEDKVHIITENIVVTSVKLAKKGIYKVPKKKKNADSFKIAIKLINNNAKKIKNNVKIMLVILNSDGKTVKIAVKNVDFSINDSNNITFYEKIDDKLIANEQYSFLFYANKILINQTKKTI